MRAVQRSSSSLAAMSPSRTRCLKWQWSSRRRPPSTGSSGVITSACLWSSSRFLCEQP
ncbi:unnamed protein product [Symbiodinium sp. CCMP2592]|nr:unnamed protein product [Symbiodinium sp. CCMP2592]